MSDAGVVPATRHLVLGTAGHIDHGKTTLVKALTGIDTDTLAEEKQRGITINLGFAYLDLPGIRVGVVDVPGHARFIRNMAAGAAGTDLLLLVVAADDGVMPQTVEHLQICRLLGVRRGLVALTKADVVEPELLELAVEDVCGLLAGTFMQDCPVIPVDSLSGRGLADLRAALARAAHGMAQRSAATGRFRMAIDRSFSIKGAGPVVTGTALSGSVAVDDELELLPSGKRLRVRGIQVHGTAAAVASAGQRSALNLAGADWQELQRGDVLAEPDWLQPTQLVDVELELLRGGWKPLRSGSAAELHINTSEVSVRLALLTARMFAPGSTGLVQLRLATPLACAPGDRFILRSSDGQRTLGGGVVLDPQPGKHVRRRAAAAEQLALLDVADPAALLLHEAAKKPYGISADSAAQLLGWDSPQLVAASAGASEQGLAVLGQGRQAFLSAPVNRERVQAYAMRRLGAYHSAHPLSRRGLSAAEIAAGLSSRAGAVPPGAVEAVLHAAAATGQLLKQLDTYILPGHTVQLTAKDNAALKALVARTRSTLSPPQPDELLPHLPVDKKRLGQLVAMLQEDGELVAAPGAVYFDPAAVEQARVALAGALNKPGTEGVTVRDFTALVATTRKYGIPLLQLFENEGWLKRDGDLRRLK